MKYLEFVGGEIDKEKTLDYFKDINNRYTVSSHSKKAYQIRRFLHYFGCGWHKESTLPAEPFYIPK